MPSFAITKISAKNFKSLSDFEINDLPKFVCLIGVNGSGKTTLLQLLGFIKSLMTGKVGDWLAEHDMIVNDILTVGGDRKFVVELYLEALIDGRKASWEAKFNTRELRCTSEKIIEDDATYTFSSGKLVIASGTKEPKVVNLEKSNYEGSIFSFILT